VYLSVRIHGHRFGERKRVKNIKNKILYEPHLSLAIPKTTVVGSSHDVAGIYNAETKKNFRHTKYPAMMRMIWECALQFKCFVR
jgi:hypothetical protein